MPYSVRPMELNYFAGFFDGEGCIMISSRKKGRPYHTLDVAVTLTRRSVLEDFQVAFGGRVYSATREKTYYKPKWQWIIGGDNAMKFLEQIKPFLRLKRQEAELGIEFQKAKESYHSSLFREARRAIEEAQYLAMKGLKK